MIGQQIGNFKIISQIGVGGMGEVYLAEQSAIGTRVAIKVLQAHISKDKDQVGRFFNEAKAVSKVRHAGPVKIFDCGYYTDSTGQQQAYLAMEFLDGESLAARIKRLGTLPGEQVSDIGRQIAGVLDAVHTAGITHRDLKPDNIFLVPDHELPSGERVKVLDFGIAKLTGTMAGPQTKGTMGTPAYMAPEQWNNAGSVDGRADTYSLGCVMYEMAVGTPPFPSGSIGEACNHHLNSKPPRASDSVRTVPAEFDALLDRMLAKTVDLRPTVKEVTRAFDSMRNSGATQRWTASAMTGVAATMAPGSSQPYLSPQSQQMPPAIGSQPYMPPGSQPNMGSQPNLGYFHLGHMPGMQNPLATPSHVPSGQQPIQHAPSAPYPVQYTPQPSSSPAIYPPPTTPQHQVQHTTPIHHTPQHQTPPPQHFTPQHATTPPEPKSKKGLIIGLAAVFVVGGGIAAAVVITQSGSKAAGPGSGTNAGLGTGSDQVVIGGQPTIDAGADKPIDAAKVAVPVDARDLRKDILAKNPFVDRYGVKLLSTQVSGREYELVIGKSPVPVTDPEAPIAMLTQTEAAAFCAAIGARLPTSEEWDKAAKGAWGIAVDAVAGPQQEWTSTIQDELVVVRGGHSAMSQDALDKAARSKPPYFLQKDTSSADRKVASGPTIGFRCVEDPNGYMGKRAPVPAAPDPGHGSASPIGGSPTAPVAVPTVSIGQPSAQGDLDKALIRRYIKANIAKITYCYEKQLLAKPTLSGTVVVAFFIAPNGTVSSANGTGVDPVVASCISTVVQGIVFPKPAGGGGVQVNYPFTFRPAGPAAPRTPDPWSGGPR